jgi:hypothetical protein
MQNRNVRLVFMAALLAFSMVSQPFNYGSILDLDNISRSGSFYHIAGISGDDFSVLKSSKKYILAIYLIRPRDYILSFASNFNVYVESPQSTAFSQASSASPASSASFQPCILFLSPRQTGQEILLDFKFAENSFAIHTASKGCTFKISFKVEIQKEESLNPKTPHHMFNIYPIQFDECKMIINDDVEMTFDLAKDRGLKGMSTYSMVDRVFGKY